MDDVYSDRKVTVTLPNYTIHHIKVALERAGFVYNLRVLIDALNGPNAQPAKPADFNIPGWDLF